MTLTRNDLLAKLAPALGATLTALLAAAPLRAQDASRASVIVAAPSEQLVLRPGDMVRVRVWPDSILGGSFPVEESGNVYLPVVGEVRVTGRSLSDLRDDLRERYGQAMKMPVVTVTPVFAVSVLGGVAHPGLFQVEPSTRLMDLVSMAGGFLPNAKEDQMRLVRNGSVRVIDLRAALEHGVDVDTLQLRSGDRVVVPMKKGGGIGIVPILQSLTLIATIWSLSKR